MNARITKPEFDSAIPSCANVLSNAEAIRLEATRMRDEAIGRWIRNAARALFRAVAEYPRRRRVYEELATLSDRELADIGLNRGDITHVFEDEFRARERLAANAPAKARPANAA
ncbi:MAG TPA: DUF1127 domain-containing protein [Roseomonas sp.]|nr:DUF1127 domain-containing protein [Roseomonas sp.]